MKIVGWFCIAALLSSVQVSFAWRSSLYPESWTPAYKDAGGRFLHDFSYAGYWKGEKPIPANPPGTTYTVTDAPYFADNTGTSDATAAIQSAIDAAGAAGGGIVYLPAGTYKVAPGANSYALRIVQNGVVLRGAGTNQTFICNTDTNIRYKSVILVQPASGGDWHADGAVSNYMARTDIGYPTRTIPLTSVSGLATGDLVVVRADCTDDFVADHGMTGLWGASLLGPTILRTITAIDAAATNVMIDIPTRYYHKMRDNARLYKVGAQVEEVGLEDFSIGMLQNDNSGWGDLDYTNSVTGAYEVHGSRAMYFLYARNCWVQRVATYKPAANTKDIHVLSNILRLTDSSHVTVSECAFQKPQYEGGGGNGYGFITQSADSLVIDCVVYHCRHNYDFGSMHTTGNVIYRSVGISPRLSSDFHMHLSMANMFDSMRLDGDWLQAVYRPYGTAPALHGHPTTESVFWNTYSDNSQSGKAVESRQWGNGYIVGTSGNTPTVSRGTTDNTAPEDLLEGEGTGETLEPQSLYADQFAKRMQGVLVDAGTDKTYLTTNAAIPLAGSIFTYGDESLTVVWSQIAGPTAVLAATNVLSTTVACTNEGTYGFRLSAWDSTITNQSDVSVTVLDGNVATLTSKDYIIGESDGPVLDYYVDGAGNQVGVGGAAGSISDRNVVLGYSLPTLDPGLTLAGATLKFEVSAARDSDGLDPQLHVYLLNTANPDGSGTDYFYHGSSNTTSEAKYVGQAYVAVGENEIFYDPDEYEFQFELSGDALALLQGFYGGDHIPDQSEVYFRFNLTPDPTVTPSVQYSRYRINLANDQSFLGILGTEPLVVDAGADRVVLAQNSSPWSPSNATTVAWYDAADAGSVQSSGGSVTSWEDKSGNDQHLTQGTSAKQPTTGTQLINGLDAIDFDGVDDQLVDADFTAPDADITMSVVLFPLDPVESTSYTVPLEILYNSGAARVDIQYKGSTRISKWYNTEGDGFMGAFTVATNEYYIYALESSGSVTKLFKNGASVGSNGTNDYTAITQLSIGAAAAGVNFAVCRIGEVVMHTVDTATRQKVEGYLAHKWGLESNLPTNHPYLSEVPLTYSATIQLNGNVVTNGAVTTWSLHSGPAPVDFDAPSALDTLATFFSPGTYVLQLTADDGSRMGVDLVTVEVLMDTDQDDLADAWELAHFGSLTNSAGLADDDYDGDGFIDLHEYLAGTNPTNALSRLAFTSGTPGLATNEFVLSWSAVTGKTYRIIGTTNLLAGPWITNATGIGGVEPLNVHTVNTTEVEMFYRIELELP